MTLAADLYADLRSRGIELEADGKRLRWRPAGLVSPRDAERIRACREALIALLRAGDTVRRCPDCRRPFDSAGRCAGCFDRLCTRCGRWTGSYFIQLCFVCGHLDDLENAP